MSVYTILSITHILTALLVTASCMPLAKDRIGRNHFYGMRVPKSFESDENWYAINRYGARRFFFWSGVLVLIGVAGLFFPLGEDTVLIVLVALAPAVVYLIGAYETYRFSKKL